MKIIYILLYIIAVLMPIMQGIGIYNNPALISIIFMIINAEVYIVLYFILIHKNSKSK